MRKFTARLHARINSLHTDQDGAGVLEYSLVAAVVSVALVGVAATFGQNVINAAETAVTGAI